MFFVLQFTIADFRRFLNQDSGYLTYPSWPNVEPQKDFIRSFGEVKYRKGGGVGELGEGGFCDAHSAIKFQSLPLLPLASNEKAVKLYPIFRRFMLNSDAVGRFTIGLVTSGQNTQNVVNQINFPRNSIESLLKTQAIINFSNKSVKTQSSYRSLEKIGGLLAQKYLYSTTSFKSISDAGIQHWWVENCSPILFVETNYPDELHRSYNGELVNDLSDDYGIRVYSFLYKKTLRVWHFHTLKSYDKVAERDLRLYLLRLHSERCVLNKVLRQIESGNISPGLGSDASNFLQGYLSKTVDRIMRFPKSINNFKQEELLKIAYFSNDYLYEYDVRVILEKLNDLIDLRPQLFDKVKRKIDEIISEERKVNHDEFLAKSDKIDKIEESTQRIEEQLKTMSEQPSVSITGGTFNAPFNIAPNHGNQPTTFIRTQNNYFGTDENFLQQISDLQQFITELETQNPNLQTEAEAKQVVQAKLTQVQKEDADLWQKLTEQMGLLKRQLLNPERHLQAAKATLVEVTKAAWEKSLIVKAIVTYIDKLSETPDKGA
jgi:hypothetical protein